MSAAVCLLPRRGAEIERSANRLRRWLSVDGVAIARVAAKGGASLATRRRTSA